MPKQLFTEGMLVLANDCGKHYGAKILRAQCFNNSWKYFIHFQHWNRKWDKWVDEGSLQKYSIDLDDQVKKCKKNEISFSKRSSYDGGGISGAAETHESFADMKETATLSRKRQKQLAQEELYDETDVNALLIMNKLQIPMLLKTHMVDEWELITREPRHLLVLPRPTPVASIIELFLEEKRLKMTESQYERYHDLFVGLRIYFDKALPAILLYKQEQVQYDVFRKNNMNTLPSSYYGAEHLLRLYAKLPKLLSTVSVPQSDLNFMQSKLCDLLKFLQKHHAMYFILSDYKKCDEISL